MNISPHVVFRELDGEAVILNLESGTYFGLNEVGTRIWQLLFEDGLLGRVCHRMCEEYDADPRTIERDVLHLASQLQLKGLAQVTEAESSA